jgi:hypothetical protein
MQAKFFNLPVKRLIKPFSHLLGYRLVTIR